MLEINLITPMVGTPKSNAWRESKREVLSHKIFRQDLSEYIFDNESRETIMQQWDYWRRRIANGDESSAPRDWFESVLKLFERGSFNT